MQFEAAEEHLRASLQLGREPGDAGGGGVLARSVRDRLRRALSGGRHRQRCNHWPRSWRPRTPTARSSSGADLLIGRRRRSEDADTASTHTCGSFATRLGAVRGSRRSRGSTPPSSGCYAGQRPRRQPTTWRPRWRPGSRRRHDQRRVPGGVDAAGRGALRAVAAVTRYGAGGCPSRGPCGPTGADPRSARRDRTRAGIASRCPGRGRDRPAADRAAAFRRPPARRGGDPGRDRARSRRRGGRAASDGRRARHPRGPDVRRPTS